MITNEAIFQYALSAYGYVLDFNTSITCQAWAEKIKQHASLINPCNKQVYETVKAQCGNITRTVKYFPQSAGLFNRPQIENDIITWVKG
jgi:hypothetical protein